MHWTKKLTLGKKSSSSNSIYQTGELQKIADRYGDSVCVTLWILFQEHTGSSTKMRDLR